MKNINLIKKIFLGVVIIIILFLLFRTTKLTITYDGLNENAVSYGTRSFSPMYKAAGSTADMSISNMMSPAVFFSTMPPDSLIAEISAISCTPLYYAFAAHSL